MNTYPVLKHIQYIRKLYESVFAELRFTCGLNQTEIDILGFLSNHPDMNTASQIADYRMIPKANISKAVDLLISKHLLAAQRDETDRRRVYLQLTDLATPIIQQIRDLHQHYGNILTTGFSQEELTLCEAYLDRMTQNAYAQLKEDSHENQ